MSLISTENPQNMILVIPIKSYQRSHPIILTMNTPLTTTILIKTEIKIERNEPNNIKKTKKNNRKIKGFYK